MIRFIDLFCGIGGFRLGLERANRAEDRRSQENQKKETETRQGLVSTKEQGSGSQGGQSDRSYNSESHDRKYGCVWSSDIDKYARQTYKKNFGEEPEGDITKIPAKSIPDHDLLCAGFPCQSFSIAGKRKGFADTRGTLFFEICRILQAKRPSYCLLENVKGLLSHDNGETFKTILESLDELGYDLQWQVLNSKHFGVPQNRERVFIIGHLREEHRPEIFPVRENNRKDGVACEKKSNGKSRISTLDSRYGQRRSTETYVRTNIKATQQRGHISNNTNGIRRQAYSNGCRIRRLTPIECERLQGFPDNWTEGVSDTQRYKLLGNAVTANVIEFLGERLKQEVFAL